MNRTNHRFQAREQAHRIEISHFTGRPGWKPLCGESCVHKFVSKWATKLDVQTKAEAANDSPSM
jgi:hypothetical protein